MFSASFMGFYFLRRRSLSPPQCVCVCVCSSCEWARLHDNDASAAVAQAIVLIHSLNVLIYCENERLRERERIIMFPLLSRLPQLSLKRGRQSTCLLIHLKLSNNRTPPISLSPSLSHFFPPHFSKLLFIAQHPNIYFLPAPSLSAPPTLVRFRLQPRLTSRLYVGLAERSPSSPCSPSPSSVPCFRAQARGKQKRRD